MSQSYPWLKLPHREYLVSISYAALKPVERLAFLELVMIAHTQENKALPDNDNALAGWAKLSTKQWLKIKANVFTEWLLIDGYWMLPAWFNVESSQENKASTNQDNVTPKQKRNAERQKRYRERNAKCNTVTQDSVTRNATVTHSDVTRNAVECNESVTNGGVKGGDLDLDQEFNSQTKTREAEKKSSRFFDDELRPDVNALNAKLGANLITQKFIDENLFSFNAHYETQQLTDNQRLAKWINWFKSEEAKKQAQTIQRPNKTPTTQVPVSKHGGFAQRDYSVGINEDGSF